VKVPRDAIDWIDEAYLRVEGDDLGRTITVSGLGFDLSVVPEEDRAAWFAEVVEALRQLGRAVHDAPASVEFLVDGAQLDELLPDEDGGSS